jgi:hypothetical protein
VLTCCWLCLLQELHAALLQLSMGLAAAAAATGQLLEAGAGKAQVLCDEAVEHVLAGDLPGSGWNVSRVSVGRSDWASVCSAGDATTPQEQHGRGGTKKAGRCAPHTCSAASCASKRSVPWTALLCVVAAITVTAPGWCFSEVLPEFQSAWTTPDGRCNFHWSLGTGQGIEYVHQCGCSTVSSVPRSASLRDAMATRVEKTVMPSQHFDTAKKVWPPNIWLVGRSFSRLFQYLSTIMAQIHHTGGP